MSLSPTLFIAFIGGIGPALIWLCFWLFEDRCEPEPKRYIFFAFAAGMVAVLPTLYIEQGLVPYIQPDFAVGVAAGPLLLFLWAATEELCKFAAAYLSALRAWVFDEPLDAVIYMVTAALGFSAVENAFFLFGSIQSGGLAHGIITGDLRFIGATLLHTLSSATIGIMLALSYYKPRATRLLYALCGAILAIALHTLFNFFILNSGGGTTLFIFLIIWVGVIGVLASLEKIKQPARDYC